MKKNNFETFALRSLLDLNTSDDYILNVDVETYSNKGKITLPAGTFVRFMSVVDLEGKVLVKDRVNNFEIVHYEQLSGMYDSVVGKTVSMGKGVCLKTQDGSFFFDKQSKYLVESVFDGYYSGERGVQEKLCLLRLLDEKGNKTSVITVECFYDIDEVF